MTSGQQVNEHEERREQGCSISAERNSRGWTISAKVWDSDDARAFVRLMDLTANLDAKYPAKLAE